MFYNTFGKYPALRTFDFLYDSYATCNGKPPARDVKEAIEWSKQGGLVVFDWHWNDPYKNSFYASNTDFSLSNAVTEEEIVGSSAEEIEIMYEEGKISQETKLIIRDMDLIAGLIGQMQDEDVTILWRPLHEAEGGWFWWGSSGAEAYRWLWKLMYERMTYYHKLDNLIWVWNGTKPEWYPSDAYCDIAGEGGTCTFQPSPDIIHGQKTIYGSWVTSLWKMEELVERLVRWNIHPETLITHEFSLEQADEAYRLMAEGQCGKVAVVFGGQEESENGKG